jgi:CheY-like chemotaxis protein
MSAQRARKVLVVDDEVLITMLLTDMLDELGCEVVGPAHDLQAAVEMAQGADIDWAILDLLLEGRPSFPVAQALRERNVPFAFASGYGTAELGDFQAVTLLQKPFSSMQLAAELNKLEG